jgi:hypothetical protein
LGTNPEKRKQTTDVVVHIAVLIVVGRDDSEGDTVADGAVE